MRMFLRVSRTKNSQIFVSKSAYWKIQDGSRRLNFGTHVLAVKKGLPLSLYYVNLIKLIEKKQSYCKFSLFNWISWLYWMWVCGFNKVWSILILKPTVICITEFTCLLTRCEGRRSNPKGYIGSICNTRDATSSAEVSFKFVINSGEVEVAGNVSMFRCEEDSKVPCDEFRR